ncbi:hypothetical protein H4R35_005609 [Dimargaris xerosporica]|nr:hypothetical protein H4R35_005609 [Dimargaris xerosporica]
MSSSQPPVSPTRVDSVTSVGSHKDTPIKNKPTSYSTPNSAGFDKTKTSEMVNNHLNAQVKDNAVQARLLQSTTEFDYTPAGSDNNVRPDMTITARAIPTDGFPRAAAKEERQNIAAVIEGKWRTRTVNKGNEPGQTALNKADGQLARYILNLYTTQPNRRFACPAQFGFDPTIQLDVATKHWVITCFGDASGNGPPAQRRFYAQHNALSIRPSLFGRRTISFLASEHPNDPPTTFIKDAWPVSPVGTTGDDPRSEITLLCHINEQFSKKSIDIPYPKLVMGGTVSQRIYDVWKCDDTTLAYGDIQATLSSLNSQLPTPVHRVHRRMVMTPIAERLKTLKDVHKLIVVLADAMACHQRLYYGCSIFHRDISTNDIMVVR